MATTQKNLTLEVTPDEAMTLARCVIDISLAHVHCLEDGTDHTDQVEHLEALRRIGPVLSRLKAALEPTGRSLSHFPLH